MKSFHLHTGPKGELIQDVAGLLVGVGLFLALHHFHIAETVWRIVAVFIGAVFVGYLCRGRFLCYLRERYPNARGIGLLHIGLTIAIFGVIARFVVPGAEEGAFTLAFILPAGQASLLSSLSIGETQMLLDRSQQLPQSTSLVTSYPRRRR